MALPALHTLVSNPNKPSQWDYQLTVKICNDDINDVNTIEFTGESDLFFTKPQKEGLILIV